MPWFYVDKLNDTCGNDGRRRMNQSKLKLLPAMNVLCFFWGEIQLFRDGAKRIAYDERYYTITQLMCIYLV